MADDNVTSSLGLSQEMKTFLDKYPGIFDINSDKNKVVCKLTKHELPLNIAALQNFINGKKFQAIVQKVKSPEVVSWIDDKYKPYFVPSKKSSSRLFCTLTKKEINKLPHEIEKYITGYKFLKAVNRDRERKEKGIENKEDTKNNDIVEMENMEDNVGDDDEEGDVPFFVMSSDEEEIGEKEHSHEDGEGEKLSKTDTEEKVNGSIVDDVVDPNEDGKEEINKHTIIADGDIRSKKRKLKRAKQKKKDKIKTKKIKPGT